MLQTFRRLLLCTALSANAAAGAAGVNASAALGGEASHSQSLLRSTSW